MPDRCSYEGCNQGRLEGDPCCIFHSTNPDKDQEAFLKALGSKTDRNYRGYVFPVEARFSGRELDGADFSLARFDASADFRFARFSGDVDFSGAHFAADADFYSTRFAGDADFRRSHFATDANFSDSRFAGGTAFHEAQFAADAHFRGSTFAGTTSFRRSDFTGEAIFTGVRFGAHADFSEARFAAATDFSLAEFAAGVDFRGARFASQAAFYRAQFIAAATFRGARFADRVDFYDARFASDADFREALFATDVDFSIATFERGGRFEGAQFHRRAADDEEQRARARANVSLAGWLDTLLGKPLPRLRPPALPSPLQHALSAYRVPPWQPLACLLALGLIIFPLAYGLTGLTWGSIGLPYLHPSAASLSSIHLGATLDSVVRLLVHSLRSTLILPDWNVRPVGALGFTLQALQFVLGPLLIALTALALRNGSRP